MLKIVIVEDSRELIDYYVQVINRVIHNESIKVEITLCTTNPYDAINYLEYNDANLFLLDIDLKSNINGIELAHHIRAKVKNAYIIFLSGHGSLVFNSFNVHPFNFLVKPILDHMLIHALLSVYEDFVYVDKGSQHDQYIDIKYFSCVHQINIKNLTYIEKKYKNTCINSNDSCIICNYNLNEIVTLLTDKKIENIVRVHKSYLVNVSYIHKIDYKRNIITLTTGKQIPIGRAYKGNIGNIR